MLDIYSDYMCWSLIDRRDVECCEVNNTENGIFHTLSFASAVCKRFGRLYRDFLHLDGSNELHFEKKNLYKCQNFRSKCRSYCLFPKSFGHETFVFVHDFGRLPKHFGSLLKVFKISLKVLPLSFTFNGFL